jgi:hypothetical protein
MNQSYSIAGMYYITYVIIAVYTHLYQHTNSYIVTAVEVTNLPVHSSIVASASDTTKSMVRSRSILRCANSLYECPSTAKCCSPTGFCSSTCSGNKAPEIPSPDLDDVEDVAKATIDNTIHDGPKTLLNRPLQNKSNVPTRRRRLRVHKSKLIAGTISGGVLLLLCGCAHICCGGGGGSTTRHNDKNDDHISDTKSVATETEHHYNEKV